MRRAIRAATLTTAVFFVGMTQGQTLDSWTNLVAGGAAAEVRAALQEGADPNAPLAQGWRPLAVAAAMNPHSEVVRLLLSAGAELESRTEVRGGAYTALHLAASSNPNPAIMRELVDLGADPYARAGGGRTLLHLTANWSPHSMISDLLYGDLKVTGEALEGNLLTLAEPLPTDAQPTSIELFMPALGFADSIRIVATGENSRRLTLEREPPFPADIASVTVHHRLAPEWIPPATTAIKQQFLNQALRLGLDVNARDEHGFTPLMDAARHSDGHEIIDLLLAAGADPLTRTSFGSTALHVAAIIRDADPQVVQLLTGAGLNVDAADKNGSTALMEAVEFGSPAMIEALLDAGANPRVPANYTRYGRTHSMMDLARTNTALYQEQKVQHPVYWRLNDLQFD